MKDKNSTERREVIVESLAHLFQMIFGFSRFSMRNRYEIIVVKIKNL